jgi:hypothetical protein
MRHDIRRTSYTPIHINDSHTLPTNYNPITITPYDYSCAFILTKSQPSQVNCASLWLAASRIRFVTWWLFQAWTKNNCKATLSKLEASYRSWINYNYRLKNIIWGRAHDNSIIFHRAVNKMGKTIPKWHYNEAPYLISRDIRPTSLA